MIFQNILEKGTWSNENQFVVELECKFLKRKVRFEIDFTNRDNDRKLSSSSEKAINDFLNLDEFNWNWIKSELYKACQDAFRNTSYGFSGAPRKENQTEFEANQDLFQIYSIDDAFEKSNLLSVSTGNDFSYSYFYMVFEVSWDNEHSVNFSFVEGQKPFVE
jgi:hypothetical protein